MFDPKRCGKSPGYVYAFRWIKLFLGMIPFLFVDLIQFITNLFKRNSDKDISGQVALVTGGGNGLGREISIELAKKGCNVVIADIDFKAATETSKILTEQYNVKSSAYKVDITKFDEVKLLKTQIDNTLGPVDILINNAGVLPTKSTFTESTPEETERVIQVNLLSNIWTIQIFLSGMKERRKGHIIAISSMGGLAAPPISNSYAATKFGVRGLMESLQADINLLDLADNINVTTVFPLFIATNENLVEYLEQNEILQYIPIMTASYVGKVVVNSILKRKREVIIPGSFVLHFLLKFFCPQNTYAYYTKKICVVKPKN